MQITAMILGAVLLLPAAHAPRQSGEGFSDVPKTHWAYEAVTALKEQGILVGYPPSQPVRISPQIVSRSRPATGRTSSRGSRVKRARQGPRK